MNLASTDWEKWTEVLKSRPKQINASEDISAWILSTVKEFFPFKAVFLAHGEQTAGEVKITHFLAYGYEPKYLGQLATTFDLETRGSLNWWFKNRKPFGIDSQNPPQFASQFEIDEIIDFELGYLAAHGVLNAKANAGTYFSFAGLSKTPSPWHEEALQLLAPVLNDVFLEFMATQIQSSLAIQEKLTSRQKQIVRLVADGMDDRSIGSILGISEKTVRNQLSVIYSQLNVSTRLQLTNMLH